MLLKFAGVKTQYAIGLRWAVDDRSGIESIQFNTDLHYGIMLDIQEKLNRKLKLVALCDASHNKAICLTGLLSSQYKNLILVHRISDLAYWVCIIKDHSVWSGMDVPKATAGDFIGNAATVNEVVEVAKAEFTAEGIDLSNILLSTDTASGDYPDFKVIDFSEFVTHLKKERKYVVRYLQPSKILLRKILVLIVLIIAVGAAGYYIYQQRLVTLLLHQQQIEQERQRQLAAQEKANYFNHIQGDIHHQVGYAVIKNVLNLLNAVPLQSQGWDLVSATYNAQSPKVLNLKLRRSAYGTLDSFLLAYSKAPENGQIAQDSNSGTKTFTLDAMALVEGAAPISEELLTQSIPKESYRLVSYMQLNTEWFNFTLKERVISKYGVNSTSFQIRGEKLWELVQLQGALSSFPTLVINKIDFVVNDYDMAWTIEGVIYA